MKDTLRVVFGLMVVFGAIYLNNGKPKGAYTLAYEIGLVVVGTIGLAVLGILALRDKRKNDDDPGGR
jgi:hypothetical protein